MDQSIAYVVKRYPRYSETFIVNEILAHEAAGLSLEIFALLPPSDTHFQSSIAQVKAPVHYLPFETAKGIDLWKSFEEAAAIFPGFWSSLTHAHGMDVRCVYQAVHLACHIRKRNLAHIHAHFATAAASVARIASHIAEVPFTFTAHAKDIYHQDINPEELKQKLLEAAAVITVSDYNLNYLKEHYGAAAARVQRIYNGIDLETFRYQSPIDRRPVILGVGRMVEKKGFSDLIEACAILKRRDIEFQCRLIGTGELEQVLRERIDRLELGREVKMIGPRPQPEVIELLKETSALAAPCVIGADGNRDGLPTVLLEAMALGTPCVSTEVTGIPEVVRHRTTGLLVSERNPVELADALQQLLRDSALRESLSRNARKLIEAEFDVRKNARKVRILFQKPSTVLVDKNAIGVGLPV
jgi:glycosyltransferase involved in cell wall biosynthesis